MGNIYWNITIPIPDDAKVNHFNMQVSRYYKGPGGKRSRTVIGRAVSDAEMHPNKKFQYLYPLLWKEHCGGREPPPYEIFAGLYALTLGIGHKTGIYPILHEVLGPQKANALMDYAMFSICKRSSSTYLFTEAMKNQMLFSRKKLTDDRFGDLFTSIDKEQIDEFRLRYLDACSQRQMSAVWLCIDGSNDDCRMQNSEYAERGHSKSGNDVPVVNFIWAVCAGTGQPVTWLVNRGSMHDATDFEAIINMLGNSKKKIMGVILDRGFLSQKVVDTVESLGLDFIIRLKNNCDGYVQMMKHHASELFENPDFVIEDERHGILYAADDKVKLFKDSKREYNVVLVYDPKNGSERRVHFMGKVIARLRKIRDKLAAGPDAQIETDDEYGGCIVPIIKRGRIKDVVLNKQKIKEHYEEKGYSAIGSSQELSPLEMISLYAQRDSSEKQFSILKSQLDGGVVRVHTDQAMLSRFMTTFVATALRTELMPACQEFGFKTNDMINQLDQVKLELSSEGVYRRIHGYSRDIGKLLKYFGVTEDVISAVADELNERLDNKTTEQYHTGGGVFDEFDRTPKRKPGRPKGSKNKKTLECEAMMNGPVIKHPHPGRPKGSKNKKTLEREAREAAQLRRGPGRPKGSKNKATIEREEQERRAREAQEANRKPGRPKGSKNKATLEREAREAREGRPPRRGPGRPKGSKNKPKT